MNHPWRSTVLPRALSVALPLALLVSLSTAASADEHAPAVPPTGEVSPTGPRFGLRTGVGLPVGSAFAGSGGLSDTISAYVPLRLDVGYRIERHFYVGIDGQVAAIIPNGCTSGFRCSGTNTRVGVMVAYHLLPTKVIDPYLGIGTGYEVLHTSRSIGDASVGITARGFELIDAELGADVRLGRAWRIGPVVSGSFGRYTSIAVNGTTSTDFDALQHVWINLGVGGAFDL
jgi:opacity protein-like surface antigen